MMKYMLYENLSQLNLLGRTVAEHGLIKCEMTDTGFEFAADFSGDITVQFDYSGESEGLLGFIIDNDIENIRTVTVNIGDSSAGADVVLPRGTYSVKVVKLNEFKLNVFHFKSIEIDGILISPPKLPKLKLEFYGDSITCGYGNLSKNRDTPMPRARFEHGYRTFAALLTHKLNAQMSISACSGFGICYSCAGIREDTYHQFWNYSLPSEHKLWDFDRYKADIVFINLGTNDICFTRNSQQIIPHELLESELTELYDGIREKNPTCKIVFLCGAMDKMKNEYIDIECIYKKLAAERGNTYYIDDIHTKQLGGDWHPSISDHRELFEMIYKNMKKQNII